MEYYRSYGKCRCCLSEGIHRSLFKDYNSGGKRIKYKDFFLDCFSVVLSTSAKVTGLICTTCIKRLLDARRFRFQTLRNERKLLKQTHNATNKEFVFLQSNAEEEEIEIKQEEIDIECDSNNDRYDESQDEYDGKCDNSSTNERVNVKEECDAESNTGVSECPHSPDYNSDSSDSNLVPGEKELLARFRAPPPLPNRDSLFSMCPVYYGRLEVLRDKITTSENIDLSPPRKKEKRRATNQKLHQILNASVLLESTNATAFKSKIRSGFPCFYCRDIYQNSTTLREHQNNHEKSLLFKLLSKYTADSLVVYADVTDLKCTLCGCEITWDKLKAHLVEEHRKTIHEVEERVIPFKLEDKESDYECQVCYKRFETFGATERHMNTHYSHYVCEECGAGFVTRHRLKIHNYIVHSRNPIIKCEPCKKTFESKYKHKIHVESVHKKLKKVRCTICNERFVDFFSRQRHMESKHGAEPLTYKCNECEKTFNRKYSLKLHYKRIHLAAKDFQCDLCPFMCFNRSDLNEHMFKHDGGGYGCEMCSKSFARKRALTVHMRIHTDDRRYSCHVCGQRFVQNCSLKTHIKSHG